MTLRGDELLNAAEIVARERNFQVTLKHSLAGGALAGFTTATGGIILGPVGLLVGGIVGGVLSYAATKDKFKPLHEIIRNDLSPAQRNQLIEHLNLALRDIDITDIAQLATLVMTNASLQSVVANAVLSFAQKELKLQLK